MYNSEMLDAGRYYALCKYQKKGRQKMINARESYTDGGELDKEIEMHVKYRMGKWYDSPINVDMNTLHNINNPAHFISLGGYDITVTPHPRNTHNNGSHRIPIWLDIMGCFGIKTSGVIIDSGDNVYYDVDTHTIFAHNRFHDKNNTVILPIYAPHLASIGAVNDQVSWDDKIDDIIWRGHSTGSVFINGSVVTLARILRGISDGRWDRVLTELSYHEVLPMFDRYNVVKRWSDQYNIKFTWYYGTGNIVDELFSGLCGEYVSFDDQCKYKYLLNLDGNDCSSGMSRFLASNSLVISPIPKWNNIFSCQLSPYEHYVPIRNDGSDLEAQLVWCRNNDDECRAISDRATAYINAFTIERECIIWNKIFNKVEENK